MAKLQDSFAVLLEDLKSSWYFRIWATIWFICAVTVFASVIVLGAKATASSDDKSWTVWIEEKNSQYFPVFLFALGSEEQGVFHSASCVGNGKELPPDSCSTTGSCYSFEGSFIKATQDENAIMCTLNATFAAGQNEAITFSIDGEDSDSSNQGFVSFAPNNDAWILLTKNVKDPSGGDDSDVWTAQLSYRSTLSTPGTYIVYIKFATFDVYHYEETTLYDRWSSVCDIGGFAFFMYILHTMFMATVNVFLDNDSHWLGGSAKKEYQNF